MDSEQSAFTDLLSTVRLLRGENGCPWDKKQTDQTLTKYLLEEVQELLAAIKHRDYPNICEETGDLFYILIMFAEIHSQQNNFSLKDVLSQINLKLIRRHPHVFSVLEDLNEEQLRIQWELIKAREKQNK